MLPGEGGRQAGCDLSKGEKEFGILRVARELTRLRGL